MNDAPKSAIELAMERFRKKDAEDGVVHKPLTDAQKAEIATIRQTCVARLAQEEILHQSRVRETIDPEERLKMDEGYRRDVQRLQDDRDRQIEKIRQA